MTKYSEEEKALAAQTGQPLDKVREAKRYGQLRRHIETNAIERTVKIFKDRGEQHCRGFAMLALLQTAWDMATAAGTEQFFMASIATLTGAHIAPITGEEEANVDNQSDESGAAEAGHGHDELDPTETSH